MFYKTILDLCGGTGAWSKPYQDAGYNVVVVTIPDDIRLWQMPADPVYGILCAPPCTYFASSGARWDRSRDQYLSALSIVDACLRFVAIKKPKFWALENPVGTLRRWLGAPKMYFNPCDYGDPYTKKTALWGEFNEPTKTPVEATEGSKMALLYGGKSEHTKTMRSITPAGFARAFFLANQ